MKRRISFFVALFLIGIQIMYIFHLLKTEKPIEYCRNYDQSIEYIELSENDSLIQKLDIFGDDRRINYVDIYVINGLLDDEAAEIKAIVGKKVISNVVIQKDYSDSFIRLNLKTDNILDDVYLQIDTNTTNGNILVGFVNEDYMNIGDIILNNSELDGALALTVNISIVNSFWYTLYIPILVIICCLYIIGLWICRKRKQVEDNPSSYRGVFLISVLINIGFLLIIEPHFLNVSHMAENSLDFYYLTEKYPVHKSLFMMDAGYLPLLQRIIAIIVVKVFNLGVNSLYFMQLVGMITDILIFSSINLFLFRKKGNEYLKFAISTAMFLLFLNPTVSTYFNFVYAGYLLIALLLISDLEEVKKSGFWFLTILSSIICMSKGLYVVMLPVALMTEIFWWKTSGKRKKIYVASIGIGAFLQLLYAFIIGGSYEKWFNSISIKKIILLLIFAMIFGIICLIFLIKHYDAISVFFDKKYNVLMLLTLFAGSYMIVILAFRRIDLADLLNWSMAWYIPAAMALIILFLELSSKEYKYINYISTFAVALLLSVSLFNTNGKLGYSYEIVDWSVYKDAFSKTCVPVFKNAERFGTMADGLTLNYTGYEPVDNYAYGAPYVFEKADNVFQEDLEAFCSELNLEKFESKEISSIYLTNINNIGNKKFELFFFDVNDNIICDVKQISPVNTKIVGFILEEPITGAVRALVKTIDGEKAFVTVDAYITTQ